MVKIKHEINEIADSMRVELVDMFMIKHDIKWLEDNLEEDIYNTVLMILQNELVDKQCERCIGCFKK